MMMDMHDKSALIEAKAFFSDPPFSANVSVVASEMLDSCIKVYTKYQDRLDMAINKNAFEDYKSKIQNLNNDIGAVHQLCPDIYLHINDSMVNDEKES